MSAGLPRPAFAYDAAPQRLTAGDMPPPNARTTPRKHASADHCAVVRELRQKRKEGLEIVKAANKMRKKAERAHRKLAKKAASLDVRELALILAMKAPAFAEGGDIGARSEEISTAEAVAQIILDLGRDARASGAR